MDAAATSHRGTRPRRRAIRDIGHALVGHDADARADRRGRHDARGADDAARRRARRATGSASTAPTAGSQPVADGERMSATTTGRSPAGPARGASTSRCTATATRSRPSSRCAPAHEGAPGAVARRHRRRAVRRRLRLRPRHRPGGRVHRRADDPLREADAAAPADRLPRPPGPPRRPQAVHRGRAGRPPDRRPAGRRPRPRPVHHRRPGASSTRRPSSSPPHPTRAPDRF